MNWLTDITTKTTRLMVGYDRYGITIREWSDEVPDGETGYTFQENVFTWAQWRKREHCYSMDDGSGRLKERIVNGAISLLGYWGGSSDSSGIVPTLEHTYDCGHVQRVA